MSYPGYPGAPAGYGGGYGGAPGAPGYAGFPGQAQDPLYPYFSAVAGQDGQIDADELQRCLTQSNISGSYKPFNIETCRLMISMLDRDCSCKMGFNEFKELWAVLSAWKQHFMTMDKDRSGTVDPEEMRQSIASMGYSINPNALVVILKRFSTHGLIAFDDYVACCIKLRTLTDAFRRRDQSQRGVASFAYDDFIQCIMSI